MKYINLVEEAQNKLENMRKNYEALTIIVELLKENLDATAQENQELREENAVYRKQLYDEASDKMFDFE